MLEFSLAISEHLGLARDDYNRIHPHAHLTIDELGIGAYLNSEHNTSFYASTHINNLELGVVHGYSHGRLLPFIRYSYKSWFVAPVYDEQAGILVGYEFKLR